MSASSFVADVAPDASIASARTGVPESVILAQWGIETGWGTSSAWRQGNNYAGVSPGGKVASYSDRAAGLAAYISTLLQGPYAGVRAAGSADAAARALGNSPWASSHYGGGGADLLSVIQANNLTQYDSAQPAGQAGLFAQLTQPGAGGTTSAPTATLTGFPGSGVAGDIASAVTDKIAGALRKPLLTATAVAGGMALIALGGWRAVQPARQAIEQKAQQAGEIAKVAAAA